MTFIAPPSRLASWTCPTRYLPRPTARGDYRGVTSFRGVTLAKRRYFIMKETGGKLRVDFRSWPLVIVIGLILAVLSLIDRGGLDEATAVVEGQACTFTVIGTDVNVRTGATAASPAVQKLNQGETVVGTTTVTNGFRQMVGGAWVLDTLL